MLAKDKVNRPTLPQIEHVGWLAQVTKSKLVPADEE